jgi:hypothetical protein
MDDLAVLIDKQTVNGKTHKPGMDSLARVYDQCLSLRERASPEQAEHPCDRRAGTFGLLCDHSVFRCIPNLHKRPSGLDILPNLAFVLHHNNSGFFYQAH